jgi:hypothetical protein
MHGFGGSPRHCVEAKPWAASSARLDQGLRGAGRDDTNGYGATPGLRRCEAAVPEGAKHAMPSLPKCARGNDEETGLPDTVEIADPFGSLRPARARIDRAPVSLLGANTPLPIAGLIFLF